MKNGIIKLEATTTELVPFQGGHIEAHRQGERWGAAIRRTCEHLDIAFEPQHRKLKTAPWAVMIMMIITGPDGKNYETACLDLDSFPMWLARDGIQYSGSGASWAGMTTDQHQRALGKLREMVKRYQHAAKDNAASRQLHLSLVTT